MGNLPHALYVSFIQPRERMRYEQDPSVLADEVEALQHISGKLPLVIVDEVQKVPLIMDVVQDLIDRKVAQFILTGSSARKLKRRGGSDINLLPGRLTYLQLDPFTYEEIIEKKPTLEDLLYYGGLPQIITTRNKSDKEALLDAYTSIYLEEEIRAEAVVRNLGNFSRFLELAASESGAIANFNKMSQDIGVSHTTIASYYQILEDCLIVERIEPITKSKRRKRLSKTQRYIFFDLGVRRLAANEGTRLPEGYIGYIFEQYVALELIRLSRLLEKKVSVKYWRDPDGPEVDWVVETTDTYIPVEVKWTERPTKDDAKHLEVFLSEYKEAKQAYIVCRTPRKLKISEHVTALPWQAIGEVLP